MLNDLDLIGSAYKDTEIVSYDTSGWQRRFELTSIELMQRLETRVAFPEVIQFLGEMETLGYIIEAGDPTVPNETAAFWHQLDVDTRTGSERLLKTRVAV